MKIFFCKDVKLMQEKFKEYKQQNKLTIPRENILVFSGLGEGVILFNTTRVIKHNPISPFEISKPEITAHRQVGEMVKF